MDNKLRTAQEPMKPSPPDEVRQTTSKSELPAAASVDDSAGRTKPINSSPMEIAHVFFMDVVAYSKLPIARQMQVLNQLRDCVYKTQEFCRARAENQLISIPTGDGMALVFFGDPEAPVRCAEETSRALRNYPEIKVRIGIHSGPVHRFADINTNLNVVGGGINIAQRVMDCGDAGHILVSESLADVLSQTGEWCDHLHDLGKVRVKHNLKVHVRNLYTNEFGNSVLPKKVLWDRRRRLVQAVLIPLIIISLLGVGIAFYLRGTGAVSNIDSLAVLPFFNQGADPDTEHLSDGLPEDIINSLGKLRILRVINRSSAFRYKGREVDARTVGRELKVGAVLTGHVNQRGNAIEVSVELVNASDNSHIWGSKYERSRSDIVGMPERIALDVSNSLGIGISNDDQQRLVKRDTENSEAYELYRRGRLYFNIRRNEDDLNKGIEYFEEAIKKDRTYALAYSGLADSYSLLTFYGKRLPNETFPKAKEAALEALKIDETLAEAHTSLARIKATYDWDWAGAEREYKRAIELRSYAGVHHWYAEHLAAMGRFNEALVQIKHALQLDPLALVINADLGEILFYAGQYDQSSEQLSRIAQTDPQYWYAHYLLGQAHEEKGKYAEAIAEFEYAQNLSPNPAVTSMLGHVHALAGRTGETRKKIEELEQLSRERYVPPYYLATIYAGLGEKDKAFQYLEKTYQDRFQGLIWLKVNPRFNSLRADIRFTKLVQRMGFPS